VRGDRLHAREAVASALDMEGAEGSPPTEHTQVGLRSTRSLDPQVRGDSAAGELALLTPDQLCSLLQVKKSWLYDQVERGAMPCLRLGKQLRFRRRDVRRYLDGLSQPPDPQA
jgi:excisionase family DNA binding protein